MSAITTHVLDTARGLPVPGMSVTLERAEGEGERRWAALGAGRTDADGRLKTLLPPGQPLAPGAYRLTFDTGAYFQKGGQPAFYPEVQIAFTVEDAAQHYHVPLLLCPYGYSTYRGS